MSTTDDPDRPPPDDGRGTADPKRSRLLIAGVVLGAVVFVITFMVLVSQCGTSDESEIYGGAASPAEISVVQ
jgi:hypothetical protein